MSGVTLAQVSCVPVNGIPMMGSKAIVTVLNGLKGDEEAVVRHDNIVRDIEKMLNDLNALKTEDTVFVKVFPSGVNAGKTEEIFLNEDLSICFVSGKNAKVRMAVVKGFQAGRAAAVDPLAGLSPSVRALVEIDMRLQVQQQQLSEVKIQIEAVEAKADKSLMCLDTAQKNNIEGLMEQWCHKCGGDYKVGSRMKRAIKATFIQGASNNNKWYHLAQKHYDDAISLINQMGASYQQ